MNPTKRDLTKQRFHKLTAMYDTGKRNKNREVMWHCECECGGICEVSTSSLTSGHTKSCGNCKCNEIIGKEFGHLTVMETVKTYNDKGKHITYCWCQCDCGNEHAIPMDKLKSKRNPNISCGCQTTNQRVKNNPRNHADITKKKFGSLTVEKCNFEIGIPSTCECICDCGNTHIVLKSELIYGHVLSCGCLKFSSYENTTEELLKDLNLSYETQKRFEDCFDKNTLPFDFYLTDYNVCIEVDGQLHYYPVEHFGGMEKYKDRVKKDNIKTEYCKINEIPLLRIPYWEFINKEDIKNKIINIIKDA